MIWGDFNIHDDKINKLSGTIDYANHMQNVGCIQLINKPTRISESCSSIIDHIYTNLVHTGQVTPTIIYDDISDHMPICAEIKGKPPHKSIARLLVRRLARANMKLFLGDLDQSLRKFTYRNNTDLNAIVSLMNDLTDRHFPKKRLSRNQYKTFKNPWITPEILASIKQKNKFYTKYIKTKCPLSLANYKKIRNKVTHDKKVAEKAYFEKLFNNTSNSTDTWKLINRLLRKHTPKAEIPQQLKVNKNTITNHTNPL